jgi:hypothetical protein
MVVAAPIHYQIKLLVVIGFHQLANALRLAEPHALALSALAFPPRVCACTADQSFT